MGPTRSGRASGTLSFSPVSLLPSGAEQAKAPSPLRSAGAVHILRRLWTAVASAARHRFGFAWSTLADVVPPFVFTRKPPHSIECNQGFGFGGSRAARNFSRLRTEPVKMVSGNRRKPSISL